MKALFFSFDRQIFIKTGDSFNRMKAYAEFLEHLSVIVFCDLRQTDIAGNMELVPTGSKKRSINFIRAILIGLKLAKKRKFDVVAVQDAFFNGLAGWLVAKMTGAKLLVGVYGSNVYDPHWQEVSVLNRILKYLAIFIYRQSDAIQTDGHENAADLKKRYGEKVFWKPLVPENIQNYKNLVKKSGGGKVKILFIARTEKQKNIEFLIEVIDQIGKKTFVKKTTFTLVGDGSEKKHLQAEIFKRKLSDMVDIKPACTRQELPGYYSSHDIFILTSYFEGFPRVFMESAAAGLPIITTRVNGAASLIADGESGFIIEQGDLDGFVEKLSRLISDEQLRMTFSKKIKENFWENYSFEITLEMQKKIFEYLKSK